MIEAFLRYKNNFYLFTKNRSKGFEEQLYCIKFQIHQEITKRNLIRKI